MLFRWWTSFIWGPCVSLPHALFQCNDSLSAPSTPPLSLSISWIRGHIHRIYVWYIYIYANIWGILMVNVTIYSIHGSYGIYIKPKLYLKPHKWWFQNYSKGFVVMSVISSWRRLQSIQNLWRPVTKNTLMRKTYHFRISSNPCCVYVLNKQGNWMKLAQWLFGNVS